MANRIRIDVSPQTAALKVAAERYGARAFYDLRAEGFGNGVNDDDVIVCGNGKINDLANIINYYCVRSEGRRLDVCCVNIKIK